MIAPKARRNAALVIAAVCTVGWPVTAFTIFADEPQGILALSWLALIFTALDIVATTDVRTEQEPKEDG